MIWDLILLIGVAYCSYRWGRSVEKEQGHD